MPKFISGIRSMNKKSFLTSLVISTFLIIGLNAHAFSFPWSNKNKTISLTLPLQCTLGEDCFILYYPDRIVQGGFRDYKCGKLSFENNKSVVFNYISATEELPGIEVIAASEGVVSKVVLDKPTKGVNSMVNTGIPYVIISHKNGFKTKYSFLNRHKILVKKGQRVSRADVIAFTNDINAGFNELYFSVLKRGRAIDPFLGADAAYGCDSRGKSLWQDNIPYTPVTVTNSKFQSNDKFEKSIYFDLQTWGLMKGDVETINLYDPDKFPMSVAINEIDTDGDFNSSRVIFEEEPARTLAKGTWTVLYKLSRNGKQIFQYKEEYILNK